MELIAIIGEALLLLIDLAAGIGDLIAWRKSRENRRVRKEARRAGLKPPPRDTWNRLWIVLTLVVVIVTAVLIFRRL
jgi:hypothetical protein